MDYKKDRHYRLSNFDYSSEGEYFITICTRDRKKEFFGKISDNKVELSEIGQIAKEKWTEIPNTYKNVKLGEFILMPDHMHALMKIEPHKPIINPALLINVNSNMNSAFEVMNNPMKLNDISLGRIIRDFKGSVKYEASRRGLSQFAWQSRYYDRIIRDEIEYYFVEKYILDNPLKWGKDDSELEEYFLRRQYER